LPFQRKFVVVWSATARIAATADERASTNT
jgi:hypothetical protein